MTLSNHIADREFQKFVEDSDGNVSVRTSPAVIADADDNELKIRTDGSIDVNSLDLKTLLHDILVELKKSNLHNEVVTGEEFQNKDVK